VRQAQSKEERKEKRIIGLEGRYDAEYQTETRRRKDSRKQGNKERESEIRKEDLSGRVLMAFDVSPYGGEAAILYKADGLLQTSSWRQSPVK